MRCCIVAAGTLVKLCSACSCIGFQASSSRSSSRTRRCTNRKMGEGVVRRDIAQLIAVSQFRSRWNSSAPRRRRSSLRRRGSDKSARPAGARRSIPSDTAAGRLRAGRRRAASRPRMRFLWVRGVMRSRTTQSALGLGGKSSSREIPCTVDHTQRVTYIRRPAAGPGKCAGAGPVLSPGRWRMLTPCQV